MRARWKQAGLILLSACTVAIAFAAYLKLLGVIGNRSAFLGYAGMGIICLAAYLAAVRWIERRVPTELSPRHALPAFAAGSVAGIALFSLVIAVLLVAGVYRPQEWIGFDGIGFAFLFWLAVAVQEEILYRGLLFRLCSRIVGTWGALLLSAVMFGASHAINPGATLVGLLSTALAGILLGAAYALTGRLWLPIGFHTGWNFAQGSVFGLSVSGNDRGSGLIAATLEGPDILTGGRFGPEASIVAVIIVLASAAFLLWRIAELRRAEPPIWSDVEGAAATDTAS